MRVARLVVTVALSIATILCSVAGFTQTETASINGRVADPEGLSVVGAKVTAINTATNVASSTQTNRAGFYNLTGLIPGAYPLSFFSLPRTIPVRALAFRADSRFLVFIAWNPFVLAPFATIPPDCQLDLGHADILLMRYIPVK